MPVEPSAIDHLLARVRSEYHEMPGLRLTFAQAARLWSVDQTTCASLLEVLVNTKFLTQTTDGAYVRADASLSNGRRSSANRATGGRPTSLHVVEPTRK